MKNITIDFDGRNESCAFFAIYAGLKMYSDLKHEETRGTGKTSISGAEAYCILQDLKETHSKHFKEAEKEYARVYLE